MANGNKPSESTLTSQWRGPRRFVEWWLAELAAIVPSAIRRWWRGTADVMFVAFNGTRLDFSRPAASGPEIFLSTELREHGLSIPVAEVRRRLAEVANKDYRLYLLVPDGQVLTRTLTLPSALAENLRQTIGFELDRYTPFRRDQAYFDYRVDGQVGAGRSLQVELAVAPRAAIDQSHAKLSALGLTIAGAALADDFKDPPGHVRNLLPDTVVANGPSTRATRRFAFAVLASLLLLGLLAVPIWQKRTAAIGLLESLAQAKTAAQGTDALRDRLNKLVDEHNFLPDKKWDSHSTVKMIEELTRLFPDDTFIMQLDFDGKGVQVVGETASSSSLLEKIEGSPLFKDVAFKSPLTKIQGTSHDRFVIAATMEGASRPKPETTTTPEAGNTVSAGTLSDARDKEAKAAP